MRTAIISGSFDPFTFGHLNLVRRAEKMFDRVAVLVCRNSGKAGYLPDEVRLESVRACFRSEPVDVLPMEGLLAEYVRRFENPVIVRGARDGTDFAYEYQVAAMNRDIGGIDTVILPAEGDLIHISSTYARDLLRYGRPVDRVVPPPAAEVILSYLGEKAE